LRVVREFKMMGSPERIHFAPLCSAFGHPLPPEIEGGRRLKVVRELEQGLGPEMSVPDPEGIGAHSRGSERGLAQP
jgi:hypothetical protein